MYWYYKYPLLVIGFVIVFGLGYMAWQRRPGAEPATGQPEVLPPLPAASDAPTAALPASPAAQPPAAPAPAPQPLPAPALKPPAAAVSAPPTSSQTAAHLLELLNAGNAKLQAGDLAGARDIGLNIIADPAVAQFDQTWNQAALLVSKANTIILTSNAPAPEKIRYIVKAGDSLDRIARNYRTTVRSLQKQNRIDFDSSRIHPEQVLHVYQGDWSIVVVKSRFVLLLMNGANLAKLYHVGIGRQNRTPVGTFKIINKEFEPAWTPPGKNIPYGHPDNVLGTRWMGIEPTGDTDSTLRGYGIHGTWRPDTIGTAASEGCVRMQNDDVNELFDIVPLGVQVIIREE